MDPFMTPEAARDPQEGSGTASRVIPCASVINSYFHNDHGRGQSGVRKVNHHQYNTGDPFVTCARVTPELEELKNMPEKAGCFHQDEPRNMSAHEPIGGTHHVGSLLTVHRSGTPVVLSALSFTDCAAITRQQAGCTSLRLRSRTRKVIFDVPSWREKILFNLWCIVHYWSSLDRWWKSRSLGSYCFKIYTAGPGWSGLFPVMGAVETRMIFQPMRQ